jgi:Tol biopolymer transport system component
MFRSFAVHLGLVLAVVMAAACVPALPGTSTAPNVNTVPAQTPTSAPIVSTIPALTDTPAPVPTATPQPAKPAVLPAPLYYLAPSGTTQQIWRIETDGTMRTQITQEAAGVNDFDVSPRAGSLAYVSGNALITTDGLGNSRSVLVQGPPLAPERNESYYTSEVTKPRWSPDGVRIAYGMNGINLIDAAGGTPIAVRPNDPIPGPNDPITQTATLYWPYSWSPDGARMLIEIGYDRGEGSMGVLNLADNSAQSLSSPQGYVCCAPAWAPDSQTIFYANPIDGIVPPGLWRTDVTTGEGETLIDGIAKDAILSAANAFPTADDNLYYFYAVTKAPSDPGQSVALSMYRAQSDGVTDQTQLRTDAYVVGEALWTSDGSGAVIVDAKSALESGTYPLTGSLLYLKADGSSAIPLAGDGRLLRWGK